MPTYLCSPFILMKPFPIFASWYNLYPLERLASWLYQVLLKSPIIKQILIIYFNTLKDPCAHGTIWDIFHWLCDGKLVVTVGEQDMVEICVCFSLQLLFIFPSAAKICLLIDCIIYYTILHNHFPIINYQAKLTKWT